MLAVRLDAQLPCSARNAASVQSVYGLYWAWRIEVLLHLQLSRVLKMNPLQCERDPLISVHAAVKASYHNTRCLATRVG